MIGKAKSIKHTSISVDYARLKENGEELGRRYLAGETGEEIAQEFRMCQGLNAKCENNTLRIILSPTVEDGQKLSNNDLREIYGDYLKRMNLEENQSIAFVHRDKAHTHIHIYANRIGFDGAAYNDSFISNRTAKVAEEIALDRGLKTARDVQMQKLESNKDIREEIKHRHKATMETKPRNLNEYIETMRANKVSVEVVQSKTGKVSGLRMEFQGNKFKASEIDRKLSFDNLMKEISQPIKIVSKIVQKGHNLGR